MPTFLSPEWVGAFNEALDGFTFQAEDASGSLVGSTGEFSVAQIVHDVPAALGIDVISTLLVVHADHVTLELTASPKDANVSVSMSYVDAAALSRGELNPAEALGAGRVRVRGDLSVLVAGQATLSSAGDRLAELHASTTY